jgi:hypothetical protein
MGGAPCRLAAKVVRDDQVMLCFHGSFAHYIPTTRFARATMAYAL